MADLIRLRDGSVRTVMDLKDRLDLIDTQVGEEARRWLEDYYAETDDLPDLEGEIEGLRAHHREVMACLREESETIAALIREKEIDRKRLSTAAGNIGTVTWRELNV